MFRYANYDEMYIPPHIEHAALERLKNRASTIKGGIDTKTGELMRWGSSKKTYRRMTVEAQGRLLKVKHHVEFSSLKSSGGGKRGSITRFTAESRKRMLDHFARMDRSLAKRGVPVLFVTLTYQRNMQNHKRAQRDLKVWWERIVERYANAWCVWKKEFQERGAIHFHLIVGNVGYLPVNPKDENEWCANRAWCEVAEESGGNLLDVERIRTFKGVMSYAAKYLGKEVEATEASERHMPVEYPIAGVTKRERLRVISKTGVDPCKEALQTRERYRAAMGLSISHKCSVPEIGSVGRFWGVLGRKHVPYATRRTRTIVLKDKLYRWWLSIVDSGYCRVNSGFTIYGDSANSHYMRVMTAWNRYEHRIWLTDYANDIRNHNKIRNLPWFMLHYTKQKKYLYRKYMTDIGGLEFDAP